MTTPPPSEGPSPEEAITKAVGEIADAMIDFDRPLALGPILERLVAAAKRSAHLEDARAGCVYCRDGGDGMFLAPGYYDRVPVFVSENNFGWRHKPTARCIAEFPSGEKWHGHSCLRPEVWDALSLPPGGQK